MVGLFHHRGTDGSMQRRRCGVHDHEDEPPHPMLNKLSERSRRRRGEGFSSLCPLSSLSPYFSRFCRRTNAPHRRVPQNATRCARNRCGTHVSVNKTDSRQRSIIFTRQTDCSDRIRVDQT